MGYGESLASRDLRHKGYGEGKGSEPLLLHDFGTEAEGGEGGGGDEVKGLTGIKARRDSQRHHPAHPLT